MGLAALLVALGVAPLAGDRARAAFPGRNGRIAFTTTYNLQSQIFVMDPDGRDQQPLTSGYLDDNYQPAFSADGRWIVFASYPGYGSGFDHIALIRADGTDERILTDAPAIDDEPAFFPSGRKIVFRRYDSRTGRRGIWVMGADGSHPHRLASGKAPAVSPHGHRIAFQSHHRIFLMRADGTHRHPLAGGHDGLQPTFSPEGGRIAFARYGEGTRRDLYVIAAGGGRARRLTRGPADDSEPAFSPNGRRIVFDRGTRTGSSIYTIRVRGGHVRRLANRSLSPDWGPLP